MKKLLVFMRHGEASESAAGGSDFERGLTPKGQAAVRAQGQVMTEKNIWPDLVLCSSAVRARQTCDILRMVWEGDMEPPVENRTDLYQAGPGEVMKMLKAQDPNQATMMVIGHNPTIHQLVLQLSAPGEFSKHPELKRGYPPASIAVLEFDVRSWAGIGDASGKLIEFITAKTA